MKNLNFEELASKPTLSVNEAVAYTGLSRTTLYRLMDEGALFYLKPVNGRRLFRRRDLDQWQESVLQGGDANA